MAPWLYSLDLFAVLCYLNVNRPKTIHKSVTFLAFRNIPVPDYRNDVKLLMCNRRKPQKNIDDLINNYNSSLQKLTDKYAQLQCKIIPLRPHAPWYISALRQEKRARRRSERDFNIHVDSSNNESQSFLDILNAIGLIQHVKSSTHQKGHILDLVITREHSNLLKRPPVVFISGVSNVKSSIIRVDHAVLAGYCAI